MRDRTISCDWQSSLKVHTCHKLWNEICEINQNFKGDLINFCEIFTKIDLELPKNNQKAAQLSVIYDY